MKPKKIPLRTCVVSHEKCEKKDLFRVLRTPDKEVVVDYTLKQNGRGAYLKKDEDVILKAKKTKILDRVLDVVVPDSIYDELIKNI
ncbi:MAG: YlxR family protein [bacterium]|nr:YlxR family protein [bacterium]